MIHLESRMLLTSWRYVSASKATSINLPHKVCLVYFGSAIPKNLKEENTLRNRPSNNISKIVIPARTVRNLNGPQKSSNRTNGSLSSSPNSLDRTLLKQFRLEKLAEKVLLPFKNKTSKNKTTAAQSKPKKREGLGPIKVIIVDSWSWRKSLKRLGLGVVILVVSLAAISFITKNQIVFKTGMESSELQPVHSQKRVKFADVQGAEEAKLELEDIAEFLTDPKKFLATGGKMPKGILLYGPPGTGKTYLARAVSGEANVPFYQMSGSEFDELYVGVGARRVRNLFNIAKKNAPSLIFIDEIDAIGSKRSSKDHTYMRQTLNQLLVELDGFTSSDGVIFIGATNIPESLDRALIRSGRIDKLVPVPLPDVRGRAKIIEVHMSNVVAGDDIDPIFIARGTPGFSGADLANLINQAAIKASKDGDECVLLKHVEWAKDNAIMGRENRSAIITEENKKMTAYHEAGHAIVAMYTEGSEPLHKITVIPRGSSLGMTVQLPEMDKNNHNKQELIAKIDVCLGGRCAEEIIYGNDKVTTGCYSDLIQATKIAEDMVTRYGMSDKVGLLSFKDGLTQSPQSRALLEEEMKKILDDAKFRATNLIKSHKEELDRLAMSLVEHETLNLGEVKMILKGEKIKSIGEKLAEVVDDFKHNPTVKV